MSWLPLRQSLREDVEAWICDLILHDPDPMLRAHLAAHRERIVRQVVDQAELLMLRQMVQERRPAPTPIALRPVNGHATVQ